MTVLSEDRSITYNGNGSVVAFDFDFPFFLTSEIVVTLITVADSSEVLLVLTTDYTVTTTGNTFRDGATITTVATYSSAFQIRIERVMDVTQLIDYTKYDAFPALFHEDALDRLTMIAQQFRDLSIALPVPTTVTTGDILYYNGTSWDVLTSGVLGLFLQAQGVGVAPIWSSAGSGNGDMLAAQYDPAGITEQLVGLIAAQTLTNKTLVIAAPTADTHAINKTYSDDPWKAVFASRYTATPSSTSVLLMSDTSDFFVGCGAEYTISGTAYRGYVTALTADTSITLAGAPMGGDVTALRSGPNQVFMLSVNCQPNFNAAAETDVLRDIANNPFLWELDDSYLVAMRITQGGVDGTTQSKINAQINGSVVFTEDTSAGPQLSTAWAWVLASAIAVDTATYKIEYGEELEIQTDQGGAGDSVEFVGQLIFVKEN